MAIHRRRLRRQKYSPTPLIRLPFTVEPIVVTESPETGLIAQFEFTATIDTTLTVYLIDAVTRNITRSIYVGSIEVGGVRATYQTPPLPRDGLLGQQMLFYVSAIGQESAAIKGLAVYCNIVPGAPRSETPEEHPTDDPPASVNAEPPPPASQPLFTLHPTRRKLIVMIRGTPTAIDLLETYEGEGRCAVCLAREASMVALPCRHACLCKHDAGIVRAKGYTCPLCRAPIEAFVRLGSRE